MMEPADELLLTEATPLSHVIEKYPQCLNHPERRMVFHCRPDLSGRRLLFQDRNSSPNDRERRQTIPVQLLTMDGCSHLGVSVTKNPSTSNTDSDSSFHPGPDDTKLARPTSSSSTAGTCTYLLSNKFQVVFLIFVPRVIVCQLTVAVAAVANILLTVLFLCPADSDAWYHVDAYQSPRGSENVQRVIAVRPTLIILAVVSNGFFTLAAYLKLDALLTVYISGNYNNFSSLLLSMERCHNHSLFLRTAATVALDVWSLVLLLPHALFLMRFLFDSLLIAIALEVRTHLEHTWFLTSFHRLRA
ncbi:hypothetical protein PR003_g7238 [Phytophthora rubi]|uniref:Uncharacterized protein n=1 Tax=Phytophthora rubi TaxID=129364 RepID=A0A6A4FUF3_9STRA|nr:hypothetical protein PR003_g7238 [Phytophthora rubi]